MAKWCGNIGFIETVETEPGVWEEKIKEEFYCGDSFKNTRGIQNSGVINSNVTVSNQISIVADPYARNHIYAMRYAEFEGANWHVTNVDVQYPRLVLTLGGLYNGN